MLDKGGTVSKPVQGKEAKAGLIATLKLEAETDMTWTTPVITEICIGMEVTSYLSAEI